jgi:peptidoglycan L-alanyl-D-glutamate endopeptidase CwlK
MISQINRDPTLLHPILRTALAVILPQLEAEGMPFGIFEGFRSPERQAQLYAEGRTQPGKVVTKAHPWDSYHQFGLAADIVGRPKSQWSWSVPESWWHRLHELGREHGLEPLSFEQPHLQVAGLKLAAIKTGSLPAGDETWARNLSAHASLPGIGLLAVANALDLGRPEVA